jgi:hypothetical protein
MARLLPTVPRLSSHEAESLDATEFYFKFEATSTPLLLQGLTRDWPATNKWQPDTFLETWGNASFDVGRTTFKYQTLAQYIEYASSTADPFPRYLFDSSFGDEHPGLLADFSRPPIFDHDVLEHFCPHNPRLRPDYRWLLVGAANAGFTLHQGISMFSFYFELFFEFHQ